LGHNVSDTLDVENIYADRSRRRGQNKVTKAADLYNSACNSDKNMQNHRSKHKTKADNAKALENARQQLRISRGRVEMYEQELSGSYL
jgi:tRNA(Glu) U13 pseudouridine synthase TruD